MSALASIPVRRPAALHRALAFAAVLAPLDAGCGDDGSGSDDAATGSSGGTSGAATTTTGGESTAGDVASLDDSGGTTTTEGGSTGSGSTASDDTGTTGPGNLDPVAFDDTYLVVMETGDLVVDAASGVLANDTDEDGDPLSVDAFDAVTVAGGTVDAMPDGSLSYSPPAGFFGEDAWTYTVGDGQGGQAVARVRVVVAPTAVSHGLTAAGVAGFAIDGMAVNDESGHSVAIASDIDGDGRSDVIIGAPQALGGAGRVWVVFGKDDGATVSLADIAMGVGGFAIDGLPGDDLGESLDGAGDVDGDGLTDLVIGAPGAGSGAGRAYVVFGKADTAAVDLANVAAGAGGGFVVSGVAGSSAGASVAGVGDVNGDGYDDLLVGAPLSGAADEGAAHVVFGAASPTPLTVATLAAGGRGFALTGAAMGDEAGTRVATAGDANGDGLADLAIAAPFNNANGSNSGAVYVVFGRTATATVALGAFAGGYVIRGGEALDQAGMTLDGVGDVDGDGRSDLAIGAPFAQIDLDFQGMAYVVHGKTSDVAVELSDVTLGNGGFALVGQSMSDFAGTSIAGLGDMDADGFADLAVGAVLSDYAALGAGRSWVVWGKGNGASVPLADVAAGMGGFALDGVILGEEAAWALAGGGDIDGDGHADLVVGARGSDVGAFNGGRTYVVFGGDYRGRVTHFGSAGADTLTGTGGPDVIVSEAGADTVRGEGGADVLYTGAGDDTIELSTAQFFRCDAGSGEDVLRVMGAGQTLDLTVVPSLGFAGVESVDLTGTGANTLVLDRLDLVGIVGPARVLVVLGDGDDVLTANLGGGAFASVPAMPGFVAWSDGVTTLVVSDALTANVTGA